MALLHKARANRLKALSNLNDQSGRTRHLLRPGASALYMRGWAG